MSTDDPSAQLTNPLALVPTTELLVALWPEFFGLSKLPAGGYDRSVANTALVVITWDLRERGLITIGEQSKKGLFGKPKTKTTVDFRELPSDVGGQALLDLDKAKAGKEPEWFLRGALPYNALNPSGAMTRIWEVGFQRGFFTKQMPQGGALKKSQSSTIYAVVPEARAGAEDAAQKLGTGYLAFVASEPELAKVLRTSAAYALPTPREDDSWTGTD